MQVKKVHRPRFGATIKASLSEKLYAEAKRRKITPNRLVNNITAAFFRAQKRKAIQQQKQKGEEQA